MCVDVGGEASPSSVSKWLNGQVLVCSRCRLAWPVCTMKPQLLSKQTLRELGGNYRGLGFRVKSFEGETRSP